MQAHCRCGKVSIELIGEPMMRATCYCGSCQAAAKMLGVSIDSEGGTDFTLYRKDRIGQASGTEHLKEHRLTPGSPMRRMVAECCHTPIAADFTKGHWLNFFAESLPPEDSRPAIRSYTAAFMGKLVLSWAAMGFRRPKLTW